MVNILLVRHGIRGVNIKLKDIEGKITYIQELTSLKIPFLATGMSITEIGQKYSYQLGQYIKKYRQKKLLVRADNTSRTQMTAKYIIDGLKNDAMDRTAIQISKIHPDPISYNQEDINANLYTRLLYQKLFEIESKYRETLDIIDKIFKVKLDGDSAYDTEFKLIGSMAFAKTFCSIAIFEYLKGSSWLHLSKDDIRKLAEFTTWTLEMRTNEILIKQRCSAPLKYIIEKLDTDDTLVVLVSHDTNIYGICKMLDLKYKLDDWPEYYIPPNSGIHIQTHQDKCIINAIGIDMDLNIIENKLDERYIHELKSLVPDIDCQDVYNVYELYV